MIPKIVVNSLISLTLLLSAPAAAQVYTLDACKQMALDNNARSRNTRLDIEAAREQKKEVFTKYFPSISATGAAFRANDPIVNTGVTLPDIGTLPIQLFEDGLIGMVTAMQPVFAGGKIVNGNRLAQIAVDAAELQHTLSQEEVVMKTERYYWQIVSIKEHLVTLNSVDTLLARIHNDVRKAVEVGVTSTNDLLKVELQQNQMASNRLELNNVLLLSKMLLAQYIGQPMDSLECLDIAYTGMDHPEKATDYFVLPAESLPTLSSYQLLDKNIEATRLETRLKRGEYLPTVAVGAQYFNENLVGGQHTNHTLVGATVSIPLSDWWGGSHAIRKKKIAERKAVNEKADLSGQLVLRIQQTWNALTESEQQIALAHSAVAQSTENLRMNRDYYNAGTAPLSDLLDAQTLYQQTCNRLTTAQVDFRVKLREYLVATGRGVERKL